MTITITASGIALDGPLVAGEKVAVSVSGLSFTAEDKPTLALLARFPDALLASVELAESAQTPGTWTGELDTATKQTALFFATARADERRDAALELVAGRVSLARLTVPMANSALCPKPDGLQFASPVYVPVPGPPGQGGDPYDQAPQMDGEASPGSAEEYARGDHRHPTDTSRASAADVADIQGIIPATASTSNKLATAEDIPEVPVASNTNPSMDFGEGAPGVKSAYSREDHVHPSDTSKANVADLAAVATSGSYNDLQNRPSLKTVAVTGSYADLTNKPTIPAAQVNSDWNASSGVAQILNKPTIPAAQIQSDWNQTNAAAADFIKNKPTSCAPLDSPAFTGTPTAPTAAAGTNTTQVATTAFVQREARYALTAPTPGVAGSDAMVACEDRSINDFTVPSGVTRLGIGLPAAMTGRARDFFCRITLTDSSLPTVTLPAGQTVDIGQSEINGMTQGVNLLMFTEIASGHWMASRRSAS